MNINLSWTELAAIILVLATIIFSWVKLTIANTLAVIKGLEKENGDSRVREATMVAEVSHIKTRMEDLKQDLDNAFKMIRNNKECDK